MQIAMDNSFIYNFYPFSDFLYLKKSIWFIFLELELLLEIEPEPEQDRSRTGAGPEQDRSRMGKDGHKNKLGGFSIKLNRKKSSNRK